MSKINELIDAIARKRNVIINKTGAVHPELSIYMHVDYYYDCLNDIRGEVTHTELSFVNNPCELMGYPVYVVIERIPVVTHPRFKIVAASASE